MKITCPGCSAEYELEDQTIPPEGMRATCPKCTTSWVVQADGTNEPLMPDAIDIAPIPEDPVTEPTISPEMDAPAANAAPAGRPAYQRPAMPTAAMADELESDAPVLRLFGKSIELPNNPLIRLLMNPIIIVGGMVSIAIVVIFIVKIGQFNRDLQSKKAGWSKVDFFAIRPGDLLHADLPLKDEITVSGSYDQNFADGLKEVATDTYRGFGEAELSFRKAAKLKTSSTLALAYLAQTYGELIPYRDQDKELVSKASYRLNRAMKQNSKVPDVYRAQAIIALNQKDYSTALKAADQSLKLSREQAENFVVQGRILLAQNAIDGALKTLNDAIAINKNLPAAYYQLGIVLEKNTNYADAEHAWREALKLNPGHSRSLLRLSKLLLDRLNRFPEALEVCVQLIEQHKADASSRELATAYLIKAQILDHTGDAAKALEIVKEGRKEDPNVVSLVIFEAQLRQRLEPGFKAEAYVDAQVKADARNEDYFLFKGRAESERTAYIDAIHTFQKGIDGSPNNAELRYALGLAYEANLDAEKAKAAYEKAIETDKGFGDAYVRLASIKLDKKDYDGAQKLLDDANARNDRIAAVHNLMARVAMAQNSLDKAQEELQKTIEIDPRFADGYRNLVDLYLMKKDYKEAEKAVLKAREIDPSNPKTLAIAAKFYQSTGKYDQAIKLYDEILKTNSKNLSVLVDLGDAAMANKDWARAEEAVSKANDLDSTNPRILAMLGRIYFERKKYQDATRVLQMALTGDPNNAETLVRLGEVSFAQGDLQEAIISLEKGITKDPNHYEGQQLLAAAYLKSNQADKALEHLEKQAELAKDNRAKSEVMVQIGDIYRGKQKTDEAKKAYTKATGLSKGNAAALYGLGSIYEEENNMQKAAQYFNAAIKADKSYAPPYRHLGYIYQQTNPRQALSNFQSYLKYAPNAEDRQEIKDLIAFMRGGR